MYSILDYNKIFTDFPDRAAELKKVTRFKSYQPMFYRSDLVTHSKHVLWLVQSLLPAIWEVFGESFDATKTQLMAAVHDDPEVVMGDIEAGIKLKMNSNQLAEIDAIEQKAIDTLAERSPQTILGYSYADLMREAVAYETLEAKIGRFADKFDAHGESLHEIYAGNRHFITPIVNEWGKIELPAPYYVKFLKEFGGRNPELEAVYKSGHVMFSRPLDPDYEKIVATSLPHLLDSLSKDSGYNHYNFWKQVILDKGDEEEIKNLYIKKE